MLIKGSTCDTMRPPARFLLFWRHKRSSGDAERSSVMRQHEHICIRHNELNDQVQKQKKYGRKMASNQRIRIKVQRSGMAVSIWMADWQKRSGFCWINPWRRLSQIWGNDYDCVMQSAETASTWRNNHTHTHTHNIFYIEFYKFRHQGVKHPTCLQVCRIQDPGATSESDH